MWKKTVLRRCSKAAPSGSDLDVLLNREDEFDRPDEHSPMWEIPPRPDPREYMMITDDHDDLPFIPSLTAAREGRCLPCRASASAN